jgi:hypothetical protein
MKIHRGQYVREPLESNKPHIIVDSTGKQRLPVGDSPPFKNRAVATRLLNQLRRKPSPFLIGDPKTWSVKVVE